MGDETVWYARRAGEFSGPGPHVAQVSDDPVGAFPGPDGTVLLMGDLTVPDRCVVPFESPRDAGMQLRVLGTFLAPCRHPACAGDPHEIRVFVAERGWFVGECPRTGFAWMRMDS